ncbi:MAG: helix-turn-helix domain-containing protein [Myxococcota bacterium]
MSAGPDSVGFGRWLRTQRELRGVSRDDVANKTKIPPTLIEALEEGQSERLPERIFLLNYLRSYATACGLSVDDVLAHFEQLPEAPKAEAFDPVALEQDRRTRARSTMWLTLASALLVVAALGLNAMYELAIRYTHR